MGYVHKSHFQRGVVGSSANMSRWGGGRGNTDEVQCIDWKWSRLGHPPCVNTVADTRGVLRGPCPSEPCTLQVSKRPGWPPIEAAT